jgi:hypothetical protein
MLLYILIIPFMVRVRARAFDSPMFPSRQRGGTAAYIFYMYQNIFIIAFSGLLVKSAALMSASPGNISP